MNFPLCSLCSLTRSLPLVSPFGPTCGCSISKAPLFRLWSICLQTRHHQKTIALRNESPIECRSGRTRDSAQHGKYRPVVHGGRGALAFGRAVGIFAGGKSVAAGRDGLLGRVRCARVGELGSGEGGGGRGGQDVVFYDQGVDWILGCGIQGGGLAGFREGIAGVAGVLVAGACDILREDSHA